MIQISTEDQVLVVDVFSSCFRFNMIRYIYIYKFSTIESFSTADHWVLLLRELAFPELYPTVCRWETATSGVYLDLAFAHHGPLTTYSSTVGFVRHLQIHFLSWFHSLNNSEGRALRTPLLRGGCTKEQHSQPPLPCPGGAFLPTTPPWL